ncbi:MAG TPA: hypothetical protein VFS05_04620 [Gemmatimonadaceae bacterium]|nr:hypothetical protein [Gemmatimonadaceae bacterium]
MTHISSLLLSNGRYTAMVTGAGGGYSRLERYALTRWAPDPTRDADGFFLYIRDLDGGGCWSAGRQPVPGAPERWAARLAPGVARTERVDDGIETVMEACVAPDHDVELRRITLVNRSGRPRRLALTTYAEVVLNTPAGDASHPAFSKLFVQTEWDAAREMLLARRRLRSPEDEPLWLGHQLRAEGAGWEGGEPERETDRARFIGRGRTLAAPAALRPWTRMSGTVGNVLDPIVSLRRVVTLAPGASARCVAVIAAGRTREQVEEIAARLAGDDAADEIFTRAAEHARATLASCGVPDGWVERLPRLTGALLHGDPARSAPVDVRREASVAPGSLARHGISTATPLVVVHARGAETLDTVRAMAAVTAWWRHAGIPVDLAVLDGSADAAAVERALAPAHHDGSGRTILLRAADVADADRLTMERVARLVVHEGAPESAGGGAAIESAGEPRFRPAGAREGGASGGATAEPAAERLRLFNGFGGFAEDGSEYVIRIAREEDGVRLPPLPWSNVVANEEAGFIVSERGAAYTWSVNSRENRVTPWLNDSVMDPHAEALYIRDEDAGVFWSPTPGPVPGAGDYEVRHGFGYTRFLHESMGLAQETVMFVPRHGPVRVVRLRITNRGDRPRRLSLFSYAQLVLGAHTFESGRLVDSARDPETGAVLAVNRFNGEFSSLVAFAAAVAPRDTPVHATASRAAFLGPRGSAERPAAVERADVLDGLTGEGLDPCAALQVTVTVAPGETVERAFLLGEAESADAAREIVRRLRAPGAVEAALEEVTTFWRRLVCAVHIETPSPALDLMVNGWLSYQNLSCRMWGRSAYYQSGGAFGFRDQLQDSSALLYLSPELTRRQILLHAAHQFVEGDVLHWWHPPLSKGMRTRFSDDLLWLPYITAFYVGRTGDHSVLDEEAGFVTARQLEPGEDEAFLIPGRADERATVYEHCRRALDRSLTAGAHGLPLMGVGDWNDGMNRVGREGRGESVWLGFFLAEILDDFIPIAERRGDREQAARWRAYRERLGAALNDAGWDGAWYRRAYYDNGAPLGSSQSDECRIDTIAQAWAVISGVAPRDRAEMALDAMEAQLVSEEERIIRLLTPAFDKTPHDPGYIKGYLPGVRENGGQYTHGALWAVRALAEAGRCERAAPLLAMLSPVSHTRTPDEVAVYMAEPYVIAADVYGVAPHVGRGGWTWYTGSAGWMFRVALESILGMELVDGDRILLRPCIPDAWPGFTLRWRLPGGETTYEIVVRRGPNPEGETTVRIDGEAGVVEDGAIVIPLVPDGGLHSVVVGLA